MPDSDPKLQPGSAQSFYISAPDGLRLHVKSYGRASTTTLPVVCLPGLARTEADFEAVARHLANDPEHPRHVVALDYRGRGKSAHDPDWRNYNLSTELADVLAVLTAFEIGSAVFIGTSRGGLLTMLMAAARPTLIAAAVLNDIGPVIEPKGLLRIKGYIGKIPAPKNFEEGATLLRRLFSTQFPKLTDRDWLAWSRRNWEETPEGLVSRYDDRLADTLKEIDPGNPAPELWPQFDALAQVPLMVIRGELSDLLSAETVTAMRQRHPHLEVLEISDQGHAPLLSDVPVLAGIASFVRRCGKASCTHRLASVA